MTPKLLIFLRLLRQHGVRLSVAESLDALHSVGQVGVYDRELLRLALRTVLIKSQKDFATFDALFERFFTIPRRRRRRTRQRTDAGTRTGQQPISHANGNLSQPTHKTPPRAPMPSVAHVLPQDRHPPETQARAHLHEIEALTELEDAWQQQFHARPLHVPAESHSSGNNLAHTRLDREFPPDRLTAMYHEVERLAARLVTRRALRYRRAHHGRFDLRRTVAQSLRSGNEVPFNLAYRRRHINKLRLLVLCDVSGSVWQVSTFLLKLVHTLQAEFTSVRSLLFVNSLVEVTPLFRHMRFPQDLTALRQYPNLNLFGYSDFGRTFYQFYQDYLGEINRDTVLLILGDARNNAFDPQAWTLEEIRQRCRRIIWLNPEPQQEWNKDDSVIDLYAPSCDHVLECWTLQHLVQAADLLLQR
jgi:uncharacterized protein with von Willebrand factor type A (vWA) domain